MWFCLKSQKGSDSVNFREWAKFVSITAYTLKLLNSLLFRTIHVPGSFGLHLPPQQQYLIQYSCNSTFSCFISSSTVKLHHPHVHLYEHFLSLRHIFGLGFVGSCKVGCFPQQHLYTVVYLCNIELASFSSFLSKGNILYLKGSVSSVCSLLELVLLLKSSLISTFLLNESKLVFWFVSFSLCKQICSEILCLKNIKNILF